MEKKMYNQPVTAVTKVEAITAIVCATQSNEQTLETGSFTPEDGGDAPQRFPKF